MCAREYLCEKCGELHAGDCAALHSNKVLLNTHPDIEEPPLVKYMSKKHIQLFKISSQILLIASAQTGGRRKETSKLLGISDRALHRYMAQAQDGII